MLALERPGGARVVGVRACGGPSSLLSVHSASSLSAWLAAAAPANIATRSKAAASRAAPPGAAHRVHAGPASDALACSQRRRPVRRAGRGRHPRGPARPPDGRTTNSRSSSKRAPESLDRPSRRIRVLARALPAVSRSSHAHTHKQAAKAAAWRSPGKQGRVAPGARLRGGIFTPASRPAARRTGPQPVWGGSEVQRQPRRDEHLEGDAVVVQQRGSSGISRAEKRHAGSVWISSSPI